MDYSRKGRLIFLVSMCAYVLCCTCMCMHASAWAHVYRYVETGGWCWVIFLDHFLPYLSRFSHWNPKLTDSASLASQLAWWSYLSLLHVRIRGKASGQPSIYMSASNLKSSPQHCTRNILFAESSHQALLFLTPI